MDSKSIYLNELAELGVLIGRGQAELNRSHLLAFVEILDLRNLKSEIVPAANFSSDNLKLRRLAAFAVVKELWGLDPVDIQKLEYSWLSPHEANDKLSLDDLVTHQILAYIVAVSYQHLLAEKRLLPVSPECARQMCEDAIFGLNNFLRTVCHKGRTRTLMMQTADGNFRSEYELMKEFYTPVGPTGKFLPNPTVSLPEIFLLLSRKKEIE